MAGEMYSVWGQMKWGPGSSCPPNLAGKTVTLKCKEGDIFEVPSEAASISLRVRNDLLSKGCDSELEYPIKKAVMGKLVEYLKHHKEHSVSEIRTPLQSDNLQDCGATRWDSSFANVDKEMLFDLTVAASYLDISSLFFLLSAKAAIMTNNKSADKLRKEFSLANDFPASEEAELRREYTASRKSQGALPDSDLSMLAAQSVIRNGMKAAEHKAGIKALENASDEASSPAVNLKSWRHAMWRAAVLDDWKLLANAPEQVKDDRDLVRGLLWASQGAALKYASAELRANEELVLEATKHFGTAFSDAAPELRNSKDFILKAVGANGAALGSAPDSFRNDKAFLLEAAKAGHGSALQGSSNALRSDRNFVLDMVVHSAAAYKYASEDLLQDKDFALAAAKRNGQTLKFMNSVFKADPDVVRTAVSRDPNAAQYAHASRRSEMGVAEALYGEEQMKEEIQNQLKAAQEEAASTTALAVAGGPRQVPLQVIQDRAQYTCMKLQKTVHFTAMSVMFANMGQANYVAANSYLDKLPAFERPEIDCVGLMWGAVGNIGMRWKAFASQDFLNQTPEALLSIADSSKVLSLACCTIDPPEWFAAGHFDELSRQGLLTVTAGQIKLESTESSTTAAEVQWEQMHDADREALKDLAIVDRRPVPSNFIEETASAPLGGWPSLVNGKAAEIPLVEGTKVRLTGLRAKNGLTGTLLQKFQDSKWKVRLDDGSGNALLREGFFEPIAATGGSAGAAAVARKPKMHFEETAEMQAYTAAAADLRKSKIEERRAQLKERIAARRQVTSSAAEAQKALAIPGAVKRQQQFFLAGTWSDWALQEMSLCSGQYYSLIMTVGSSGQEAFQVLLDRSWNACLHAGDRPAELGGGFQVQGPDPKWRCEGMNFVISGEPGSLYEVKLFLNAKGNAHRVEWARTSGTTTSEKRRAAGSAAARVDVSTTPPASVTDEDSGPASASEGETRCS
eukprot:gb/GFBE01062494.1/.p1 GENE.gb/GFBE01062494.1/~~gb/GFBE01062494.1/.p1  ORF type:complete len:967 (+),score=258.36 gb/GFBE01062494.1/:1-2901(+)